MVKRKSIEWTGGGGVLQISCYVVGSNSRPSDLSKTKREKKFEHIEQIEPASFHTAAHAFTI